MKVLVELSYIRELQKYPAMYGTAIGILDNLLNEIKTRQILPIWHIYVTCVSHREALDIDAKQAQNAVRNKLQLPQKQTKGK